MIIVDFGGKRLFVEVPPGYSKEDLKRFIYGDYAEFMNKFGMFSFLCKTEKFQQMFAGFMKEKFPDSDIHNQERPSRQLSDAM
jgi:hypothetical protein